MRRKEIYLPRTYQPKDSNPRKWHVEYSFFDEVEGKMRRFKITKGFAACTTVEECKKNANKIKAEYTRKLLNGWSPFEDSKRVVWSDSLAYHKISKGKKPVYRSKKTVAYYTTTFLKKFEHNAPKTYNSYESKLRTFRNWLKENKLGNKDVSLLEKNIALKFVNYLHKEEKRAAKTKNEYTRLLSAFWNHIKEERPRLENIWSDIPKYKSDTVPQRPLKKGVMKILKTELEKRNHQLLLAGQFMYYCFIRPGELRQMQIKHLDLYGGTITLYSNMTKNRKTRTVDVSETFLDVLINKYELHKFPEEYYVFSSDGEPGLQPVSANYFNKQFKKIRRDLKLPEFYKFYGFKHTGAVVATRAGADIKAIQNQMGHHSISQTDEYLKSMIGYDSEFFRKQMPDF